MAMHKLTPFEQSLSLYSDCYKEAFGFRPRNYEFATVEEIDEAIRALQPIIDEEDARRTELQTRNHTLWAARIDKMCQDYNISRATAIRWDMTAEDCGSDTHYYCFCLDIDYDHAPAIQAILKEEV